MTHRGKSRKEATRPTPPPYPQPWTRRRPRQATPGMKSRSWPGIEGDGVKFPWTYAPHGVKEDKSSKSGIPEQQYISNCNDY